MAQRLTAADLFSGCGGTSEGARLAGLDVLVAANHEPLAVEIHRTNHPNVEHLLQDLHQADFTRWPDFHVLLASPACQGFSRARGTDEPRHEANRATAWAVIAAVEAKWPAYVAVENVADFSRWALYRQWRSCLETLGYHVAEQLLDAADVGVPQNRERWFVTAVRRDVSDGPLAVEPGRSPHVAVREVLEWESGKWGPVAREGSRPRSPATLARVARGRRELGRQFIMPYFGSGSGLTGRSLARPVGTITTRDRWALVDGDRMRMLTIAETKRAQGFRDDYVLPPTRMEAVALLGDAVPPPLAQRVIETFVRHDRMIGGARPGVRQTRPLRLSRGRLARRLRAA